MLAGMVSPGIFLPHTDAHSGVMVLPLPGAEEEATVRFCHAKQVQSPVPWPAAILTPTLSIPTLLPAGCLNILIFHDAKHPSTTAFPPWCRTSRHHCLL